jgi:dolichol-phosphate mannosyltransferase
VRSVIVLPTYNEAENIVELLRALRETVPESDVLVIDDCSPDCTADLAEEIGAGLGAIKVLRRPGKASLGDAYRYGFTVAFDEGYPVIVSMDADFSHDPAVIPRMLALIEDGAAVVVGSRYVTGGGTLHWPAHRRLLSKWGNRYTGALLGIRVSDCTSGFRAYRADRLREIDPASTTAEGYAFLTELIRELVRHGAAVVETPILFRDRVRGTSKMSWPIIAESMLLVTRWGVGDRLSRLRGVLASRSRGRG